LKGVTDPSNQQVRSFYLGSETKTRCNSEANSEQQKTTGFQPSTVLHLDKILRYQVADGRALFAAARGKEFLMAEMINSTVRLVNSGIRIAAIAASKSFSPQFLLTRKLLDVLLVIFVHLHPLNFSKTEKQKNAKR